MDPFNDAHLSKLVEELEELYPALNPRPTDDLAKIMYLAGQRSVIEYLLSRIENNVRS